MTKREIFLIALTLVFTIHFISTNFFFDKQLNYTSLSLKKNPLLYAYVVETDNFLKLEIGKSVVDTDGSSYDNPWFYKLVQK
jgi:hypothetical protein